MTGGHRHSQYCLKISGIPGNAWFPQLTVTYTCLYTGLTYTIETCAQGNTIVTCTQDKYALPVNFTGQTASIYIFLAGIN